MTSRIIQTILLSVLYLIYSSTSMPLLWPLPKQLQINSTAAPVDVSPCEVRYIIESPLQPYIDNLVKFYLERVFSCSSQTSSDFNLNIIVPANAINIPLQTNQDKYSIVIRENGRWELQAAEYTGFLRGLQTYSQLFQQKKSNYFIQGIPIVIDDLPDFKWRGLMIDSSRHYLPLEVIKKTIDALMFNKMNILHWHVIDQDSFPLFIPAMPELSHYGQIGGTYSMDEVVELTEYAKSRGVRMVVELDTPAHTHSWGRTPPFQASVVNCNNIYTGQFDPTLDQTYDLVYHVMNYANILFDDPYIHFGGDETSDSCWDLKPSIKNWMGTHNISSYKELSSYYRNRQKSVWRNISKTKKAIYWANQAIDLPLMKDDVVQWWGDTSHLDQLADRQNEVILSNQDLTYLDVGFGRRQGTTYGTYINWRQMYKFSARYPNVNIIGGQTCMWGQLNNRHTHEQKIWIRTSVLGERLWNDGIKIDDNVRDVAKRLVAHSKRMKKRGYKVSPVTVELCEQNIQLCFP